MRMRHLLPAMVLGVGLLALMALPAPAEGPVDAKKITKLIEQLGSDTFEDRQKATDALDAIGAPALEALRKAASSGDAEVKKRAADLVSRIARRVESGAALKPTMVELSYKDTAVSTILADLQKKTGYNIVLHDPEGKMKDKKITLHTGKTTFWAALQQLCSKAGLVEGDPNLHEMVPLPPPPVPVAPGVRPVPPAKIGGAVRVGPAVRAVRAVPLPAKVEKAPGKEEDKKEEKEKEAREADKRDAKKREDEKKAEEARKAAEEARKAAEVARLKELAKRAALAGAAGGGAAGAPAIAIAPAVPPVLGGPVPVPVPPVFPGGRPWVPVQQGQITLMPGKPVENADTATAVRVGLTDKKYWGTVGDKELQLVLQVTPEPKLRWQRLAAVSIDKAIDDNDQKLSQVMVANPVGGGVPGAPGGVIVLPGGGVAMPGFPGGGPAVGMPFIPHSPSGLYHHVPVRLARGAKESKSLKELTGTISGQVLGAAEAVITVENVTKAAGKSFKGKNGGEIQITAVNKQADGSLQITFEFDMPSDVTPETQINVPGAVNPVAPGGIRILPGRRVVPPAPPAAVPPAPAGAPVKGAAVGGAVAGRAVAVVAQPAVAVKELPVVGGGGVGIAVPGGMAMPVRYSPYGLTLQDDKGNILPASIYPNYRKGGGVVGPGRKMEYIAVYRVVGKGAAEPAKLVFTGRRSIDVNIPFTLKNIELK